MSLITRCPDCGTLFRVVPDQLRISGGWVRCGHCDEVFDASAHLQTLSLRDDAPTPPTHLPPAHDSAMEPDWEPQAQNFADKEVTWVTPSLAVLPDPVLEPAPLNLELPEPPPAWIPRPVTDVGQERRSGLVISTTWQPDAEPATRSPKSLAPAPLEPPVPVAVVLPPAPPPVVLPDPVELVSETPVDSFFGAGDDTLPLHQDDPDEHPAPPATDSGLHADEVSFVRDARRKSFWRHTRVRIMLASLLLLLLAVLIVQVAVHERDRLVAMEPRLRPVLTALCGQLGCTVTAPRHIEAVVIDGSTFNKIRNDMFRLSFTVRNTSDQEVATPAVELTLTDVQDQSVLRRIFQPADVGGGAILPAKGEWNAVLSLNIEASEVSARISGYRLLAFYP